MPCQLRHTNFVWTWQYLTNGQCFGWKRYHPLVMKVKHEQKDKVSGISQQPLQLVTIHYFYDVLGSDSRRQVLPSPKRFQQQQCEGKVTGKICITRLFASRNQFERIVLCVESSQRQQAVRVNFAGVARNAHPTPRPHRMSLPLHMLFEQQHSAHCHGAGPTARAIWRKVVAGQLKSWG